MRQQRWSKLRSSHITAVICITLFLQSPGILLAQAPQPVPPPPPPDSAQQPQLLSSNQLDDLVATIALYPDPLISQVLVAATYPLEVVEAYQWLQRNPGLTGTALTQAAEGQNWDPSVQALVIFPDVIKRLNEDISWTTNLGNAFLAQETDVMNAVQRMRLKAQQAGKLVSTPQQQVQTTTNADQTVVTILPTNPEVLYVPVYDPVWIWGPPIYYPYARWYFAPHAPVLFFGVGVPVVSFFGGGWGGWGGWGWFPRWSNRTVIINNSFIHRYNFNSTHIHALAGTAVWSHDPFHRHGVGYPSRVLNERFRAGVRENLRPRPVPAPGSFATRPSAPFSRPMERMGNRSIAPSVPNHNRSAFGGIEDGAAARLHTDHGFSSLGPARIAPRPPAQAPHAFAPRGSSRASRGRR